LPDQTNNPYSKYVEAVQASAEIDPMPTVHALAKNAELTSDEVIHYILVQWATSGSEALMATTPLALRQLKEAADAGDTEKVRGIVSWLMAGF
jgi:hypothetical protein